MGTFQYFGSAMVPTDHKVHGALGIRGLAGVPVEALYTCGRSGRPITTPTATDGSHYTLAGPDFASGFDRRSRGCARLQSGYAFLPPRDLVLGKGQWVQATRCFDQ
jgi:hypothetical protein